MEEDLDDYTVLPPTNKSFFVSLFLRPSNNKSKNNKNKNKIQGKTFLLVALLGKWLFFLSLLSNSSSSSLFSFPFLSFSFLVELHISYQARPYSFFSPLPSPPSYMLSFSYLFYSPSPLLSYLFCSPSPISSVLLSPPIFFLPSSLPLTHSITFQRQSRIIVIISCILPVSSILLLFLFSIVSTIFSLVSSLCSRFLFGVRGEKEERRRRKKRKEKEKRSYLAIYLAIFICIHREEETEKLKVSGSFLFLFFFFFSFFFPFPFPFLLFFSRVP